ncbi:hypothetical protein [Hymenobacter terricola]|uniref:hypothetical protein n=1 Tax=Hymenobacter terricola TaxID=2819236 RepID=UPI001B3066EC|nr:hypothetical protein [Hymenobacter terricola]
MKKILYLLLLSGCLASTSSCSKDDTDPKCGFYNGNQLYKGPQNGCYYINSSGNKEYVAHSYCNC